MSAVIGSQIYFLNMEYQGVNNLALHKLNFGKIILFTSDSAENL